MNDHQTKWRDGLARTRSTTFGKIANFLGTSDIDAQAWEDLEALLIQADLGVPTTVDLIARLQSRASQEGWTQAEQLKTALKSALEELIPLSPVFETNPDGPTVILVVGVNGSGKTTTVAKLAKSFQAEGRSVVVAAADTFRAAAIEQLETWGARLSVRVVTGQPGGDPGAVTYDAVKSALARREDILLVDTAGRLHTRYNLMEELKKVHRVAAKACPGAPHAVWLVIDATTGQNALHQARAFKEAVGVTAVILAKLDSSARGGMAFAIQKELGLPILFAGLGEGPDDLQPFDQQAFIEGILTNF